jgi:hypothetical protein
MSSAAPVKRTTKKAAVAAAPVVAVPAAPVVAAAPAKATKAAVVATAAPAATAAPVVAPVVSEPATAVAADQVNIVNEFAALAEQVEQAWSFIGSVRSAVKKFQKQLPREIKKVSKRRGRKAPAVSENGEPVVAKPSVFTKPTAVSDALCQFLGIAKGTLVSRSSVTKQVCDYAKTKGLMDKQTINADAALRKLFSLTEADHLKILNLQRYLKPHYLKAPVAAPVKA